MFYNRLLRCYVLIDLKGGKLTHQDLRQWQIYVSYFDRYVKTDDELPTIGILLCDHKNDAVVELTLPEDANNLRVEIPALLAVETGPCRSTREGLPGDWGTREWKP